MVEVCNLTRSSVPYTRARGARRGMHPPLSFELLASFSTCGGPSPCSCLHSWVTPVGATSLQTSPWAAERSGYGSEWLSWSCTNWSTVVSAPPDVAFQGFSSSFKVVCVQGGCELGAALKVNSVMIFLRLVVLYQYQLYSFSPLPPFPCVFWRSWHLIIWGWSSWTKSIGLLEGELGRGDLFLFWVLNFTSGSAQQEETCIYTLGKSGTALF